MTAPTLILVAEVHGLAGRSGELRELLDALAEGSDAEPDCLSFRVFTRDEPGEFVILSEWANEAALAAHYETPHYQRYRDAIGPLLARPSDAVVHHVSATIQTIDPAPPDPARLG
jgi:quinol monooxygenase YgiN